MAEKPVHTLVLDAGPIIKNEPAVATLLAQAETLVTTPAVIAEIRDAAARQRVQTTLMPFLTLRNPNPESVKILTDFARRTGDLAVLSRTDIQILALAYELECERNGGNWRLRSVPGQKRTNGPPPKPAETPTDSQEQASTAVSGEIEPSVESKEESNVLHEQTVDVPPHEDGHVQPEPDAIDNTQNADLASSSIPAPPASALVDEPLDKQESSQHVQAVDDASESLANLDVSENLAEEKSTDPTISEVTDTPIEQEVDDAESTGSDSEGWITPSNLKKRQAKDAATSISQTPEPKTMQVAMITTDFAMQNVLLQMNLNLLSTSLQRVRHIKTYVLRCHACFLVVRDMAKQFCPRCGKPSLTRVSCSTNQNGEFKLHLKKNMQWNTRGDRYSIPKPISGTANGRLRESGGGKGGWGQNLILAEDQKEYVRAIATEKRRKERDLLDDDYLPGILTGERMSQGGRPKIGAGKTVNSRKQR